jgi:opacity protein-like surface antigen
VKKALLLTLALVFAIGLSASAQELSVNLDGGYLFGNAEEGIVTATHNGFVFSADAAISGRFGAMLNFASLESSDLELDGEPVPEEENREQSTSRFDVLATYALPVDSADVKLALGNTSTSLNQKMDLGYGKAADLLASETEPVDDWYWEKDATISGAMIGISGKLAPTDKVTLIGFAGLGVGLTVDGSITDTYDEDEYDIEDECSLTVLKAAAAYQFTENVALEASYEYDKYAFDEDENDLTIDGFFLGARMSF